MTERRFYHCPLMLVMIALILPGVLWAQPLAVDIPDSNLERVLRKVMELPPGDDITKQRMADLDALNAPNEGITLLTGMEFATSLRDLRLGHNKISDLTPLASLTQLERLYLEDGLVSDLQPLSGMVQLADLDLSFCNIFDVSPLSNLTHLLGLNLTANRITDVRPLANLINLERLYLGHNRIADVRPLANLINLDILYLERNRIIDVRPLSNLVNLERLHIDHNLIVDLSPLAGLTGLASLGISYNRIENLSPLANLTQLTQLWLENNKIKDVRPLASLTRLEILHIRANNITDHSPLDGLSLTDFRYDQVCDMSPLPLQPRLANRDYPNVAGAIWIFGQDPRIDLIYGNSLFQMHLRADGRLTGDFERALKERDDYIAANPNAVFLMALNEMNAPAIDYWGAEWPYWIRDSDGNIVFDIPFTEGGPTPGGW